MLFRSRPAPGASHAERTASLLERDIVRGMFAPGEHLPSAKELCSRYGAGYRAMRRAVARVATRGFLTIEGGLRVASPLEGHYSTATVMAIGLRTPFHPIFGAPPINVLRDACLRSRVRLSVCPGGGGRRFAQTDKLLRAHVRNRRALTDTIGYLIITSGMHRAKLLEYLSLIVRLGKPIAIVDDTGHAAECASRSTAGSRIGVFPLGTGSVAGRRLGHYLANQGHRRVGYISVDHDTIPSQIRHAGLTDAIRAAGGEVVPFVRRESRPHSLLTRIFDRAWPAVRQFASSETLKHYLSPSGATMAEGYLNKALLDLLVQQVLVDTATPLIEQAARTADLTA